MNDHHFDYAKFLVTGSAFYRMISCPSVMFLTISPSLGSRSGLMLYPSRLLYFSQASPATLRRILLMNQRPPQLARIPFFAVLIITNINSTVGPVELDLNTPRGQSSEHTLPLWLRSSAHYDGDHCLGDQALASQAAVLSPLRSGQLDLFDGNVLDSLWALSITLRPSHPE
ncbi:hypothetical protein PoB_007473400 [Plakobranchus ocellatus]|uniref:Uncharacterized protein n=1 Tax=Plakobranchus ocellatus TaxID=259542 RepID=A0AAV4DVS4_9GAST|nr:hypothetical protein PoB_007473400 [Plakobranchus ocellatus]